MCIRDSAYITGIVMDSPAMVAGIQSGDVIVKMGTEEITSFKEYKEEMMTLLPDSQTVSYTHLKK